MTNPMQDIVNMEGYCHLYMLLTLRFVRLSKAKYNKMVDNLQYIRVCCKSTLPTLFGHRLAAIADWLRIFAAVSRIRSLVIPAAQFVGDAVGSDHDKASAKR
jgi:hypothetical protein